jgi:glycosyltransferase involved in cell wall biosynthesis
MNVLHLASWYPHEKDPYSGDFIQRQLTALAENLPVTVIHLVKDSSLNRNDVRLSKNKRTNNMEEWVASYGAIKTGIPFADQLLSFFKYKHLLKKLVNIYILENGKPDLIHAHVVLHAGIVAMEISKELNIPYAITEHSSVYQHTATENLWNRFFYFRWVSFKVLKNAKLVVTVSSHLANRISSLVKIRKLSVISNTVDTTLFHFKNKSVSKPFQFIHVSGMTNAKNIENMLKAFFQLKEKRNDWHCMMVGPASENLKQRATAFGLDAYLDWKGEVSYPEVARLMQESNAHVLFSRYENQPCVNLEAFCCGLPVIATNVGGIAEVVKDSNGILVEPDDISSLVYAMEKMIDQYEMFNGAEISREAVHLYNYAAIGESMYNSYLTLLNDKNKRVH